MKINIIDFENLINSGDVLVYFYADWCGKCKMVSMELGKINSLKILKVDADKNRDICKKYGVMSLPTLIYFKSDGSFNSLTGLVSSDDILDFIKK